MITMMKKTKSVQNDLLLKQSVRGRSAESGLRFLCVLAEALHTFGTSADRLEEALEQCAQKLGLSAQFFVTPTSLQISVETKRGEIARMIRVKSSILNLDKLDRTDKVMKAVLRGDLGPDAARIKICEIKKSRNRYSEWMRVLGFASASALVARLFDGGTLEVLLTAGTGLVVGGLSAGLAMVERFRPLSNVLSSLIASFIAFFFFRNDQDAAMLVTVASLILLMPGLKVTTAMRELATQHLTSGTTRMMSAIGHLLGLAFGVALGRQLAQGVDFIVDLPQVPVAEGWTQLLAVLLTPLALMVDYQVRLRDLPILMVGCTVAYFTAREGSAQTSPEFGAFLGALAVGVLANLFSRSFDRPSSLLLIPGVTLLVPGSIGFQSVVALLDHNALSGVETGFTMVLVGTALGSGLIVANVLVAPRRSI